MSLFTYLVILVALFFSINCKFSETPVYSFMAYDFSKEQYFTQMILSTDEDKIAINSYKSGFHQDVLSFNGSKVC